jgi:hypothetical protein
MDMSFKRKVLELSKNIKSSIGVLVQLHPPILIRHVLAAAIRLQYNVANCCHDICF